LVAAICLLQRSADDSSSTDQPLNSMAMRAASVRNIGLLVTGTWNLVSVFIILALANNICIFAWVLSYVFKDTANPLIQSQFWSNNFREDSPAPSKILQI